MSRPEIDLESNLKSVGHGLEFLTRDPKIPTQKLENKVKPRRNPNVTDLTIIFSRDTSFKYIKFLCCSPKIDILVFNIFFYAYKKNVINFWKKLLRKKVILWILPLFCFLATMEHSLCYIIVIRLANFLGYEEWWLMSFWNFLWCSLLALLCDKDLRIWFWTLN